MKAIPKAQVPGLTKARNPIQIVALLAVSIITVWTVLMCAGVDKDCTQGAAFDYARRSYTPHLRISQQTLRVNDPRSSGG